MPAFTTTLAFLPAHYHGRALLLSIFICLFVGFLALFSLTLVPPRYRKLVVMVITFVGGLYLSLEFLLPHDPIKIGHNVVPGSVGVAQFANMLTVNRPSVADWAMIIGSFTLLLGTFNLFVIHSKTLRRRGSGWYNSAAFFVAFFFILISGFLKDYGGGAAKTVSENIYNILFNGFMQSLDATMFSLIAFYIISAAYRAFRVRSAEAALMMGTAAIIMLGIVPIGAWLTNWIPVHGHLGWLRLESLTIWLLTWPNMAVQRAIGFGLAVGAMAMSLRIWLSLERGSFFDRQL